MPKIVTEKEKEMLKEALYVHTIQLIKETGVKGITVEAIIQSVGIAKGTFYKYYPSKEDLLLHVIQKSEENLFQGVLAIDFSTGDFRETIIKTLKEIYLGEESIVLYLSPEDISSLVDKLPEKNRIHLLEKQANNFKRIAKLFDIDLNNKEVFGVISYLMDCLHFTAVNPSDYGSDARQQSLEIIIYALADFLEIKKNVGGVKHENSNN